MHDEEIGDGDCLRNRHKVAQRVVAAIGLQAHRNGEAADRAVQDLIAVRRPFGNVFSADHAAGAGAVVNDHGLAPCLG